MISLSSVRKTRTRRPSPVSSTLPATSTCPRIGRDMFVPGNCTCTSPFHSETMAPAKGAGEGPGAGTWAWAVHKDNTIQRHVPATAAQPRETLNPCKTGPRRLGRASLRVPVTALFQGNDTLTSYNDRNRLARVAIHLNFTFGAVCDGDIPDLQALPL